MRRRTIVRFMDALVILPVLLTAAPALLETGLLAAEREGTRVVVADFDYSDSSGEIADQRAEHAVRVNAFAALLRNRLADEGKYKSCISIARKRPARPEMSARTISSLLRGMSTRNS
ncbi:MAG: hypothetical protein WA760_21745 [Pseudolabrys sp.]